MSRFLVIFKVADDVRAAGKNDLPKGLHGTRVAKEWIADADGGGGEFWFIERAGHESARRYDDVAGRRRGPGKRIVAGLDAYGCAQKTDEEHEVESAGLHGSSL
jgi:hypothetical protein